MTIPTATNFEELTPAEASALYERMKKYSPREPDSPVTDGQAALLQRYELKVRKGMTQGAASQALLKFYLKNPQKYLEYLQETSARRKAEWGKRAKDNHAVCVARARLENRIPATPGQVRAVMRAAWIRGDLTEVQRVEARMMITQGFSAAVAHEYLNGLPRSDGDQADSRLN
ncbi:MAG TPA: hypothetical protein VFS20_09755 [Longimicrobium sp.]|nr:hypothetical protein [Longimicrobium sp.]